jgi:hypothetical protein
LVILPTVLVMLSAIHIVLLTALLEKWWPNLIARILLNYYKVRVVNASTAIFKTFTKIVRQNSIIVIILTFNWGRWRIMHRILINSSWVIYLELASARAWHTLKGTVYVCFKLWPLHIVLLRSYWMININFWSEMSHIFLFAAPYGVIILKWVLIFMVAVKTILVHWVLGFPVIALILFAISWSVFVHLQVQLELISAKGPLAQYTLNHL